MTDAEGVAMLVPVCVRLSAKLNGADIHSLRCKHEPKKTSSLSMNTNDFDDDFSYSLITNAWMFVPEPEP